MKGSPVRVRASAHRKAPHRECFRFLIQSPGGTGGNASHKALARAREAGFLFSSWAVFAPSQTGGQRLAWWRAGAKVPLSRSGVGATFACQFGRSRVLSFARALQRKIVRATGMPQEVRAKGRELAEARRRLKVAEYLLALYEFHFPWLEGSVISKPRSTTSSRPTCRARKNPLDNRSPRFKAPP
jgi:hypothetical protein